ncbi:hypothetical protein GGR52DRAFT_232672 [Hypoxylon sp. FL1284]|nr:hypothetical protein GGR52DRAFT_232672 [Hypoxylon sp. FL1284]
MTAPSVPRVRARRPKVRTGCSTCKSRRIKCDEARPVCGRCQRSRLPCQYHDSEAAPDSPKGRHNTLPSSQQLLRQRESVGMRIPPRVKIEDFKDPEVYYFDVFRHTIVENLCQNGYISLWSCIILRESFRDECVRDAVLGIGALCRALMEDNQHVNVKLTKPLWAVPTIAVTCPRTKVHQDAIKYYIKSIGRFSNRISREGSSTPPRIIVILSILFILFETIQGDTDSIDRIMLSAIAALKGHPRQGVEPRRRRRVSPTLDDEDVREADSFLTRLSGFSPLLSPFYPSLLKNKEHEASAVVKVGVPSPNLTLVQVEQGFEEFATSALIWCFRTVQGNTFGHSLDAAQHRAEQLLVSAQAEAWCDFIARKLAGEEDGWRRRTWKIMLVEAKMFSIYTTPCQDADDYRRVWDERLDDCREAVALAESVLDEPTPFSSLPPLFEDKLLPTLRCFICKCRDAETRARALKLCVRLAGPWFENRAILVGLQIMIAMEEKEDEEQCDGGDPSGFIPIRLQYRWNESSWNDDRTELRMVLTRILTGARKEFTIHSNSDVEDMIMRLGNTTIS